MVERNGTPPKAMGKYELLAHLGHGGMAEVLLGRVTGEGGFSKLVALKCIHAHLCTRPDFVHMFMDEARVCAGLHHANIAQIYEFGRIDDRYFIAMEFIRGANLARVQRHFFERGILPPFPMSAYVVSCVCAALEYAHTRHGSDGTPLNIVHRDVSPANILCSIEGEVKLIDFGIARAAGRIYETTGGGFKGKIAYMSPEQASGGAIDRRSDIFAAGVVLYELLTNHNPFGGHELGVLDTLNRLRECRIPPPSSVVRELPGELERVCLRALSRRPEDRYQAAGEMQAELEVYCFETHYGARQFGQWMKKNFPHQAGPPGPGGRPAARDDVQLPHDSRRASSDIPPDSLAASAELPTRKYDEQTLPVGEAASRDRPADEVSTLLEGRDEPLPGRSRLSPNGGRPGQAAPSPGLRQALEDQLGRGTLPTHSAGLGEDTPRPDARPRRGRWGWWLAAMAAAAVLSASVLIFRQHAPVARPQPKQGGAPASRPVATTVSNGAKRPPDSRLAERPAALEAGLGVSPSVLPTATDAGARHATRKLGRKRSKPARTKLGGEPAGKEEDPEDVGW